jgi:hypothetical protein
MFVELSLENRLCMIYTRLVYFVKDAFKRKMKNDFKKEEKEPIVKRN